MRELRSLPRRRTWRWTLVATVLIAVFVAGCGVAAPKAPPVGQTPSSTPSAPSSPPAPSTPQPGTPQAPLTESLKVHFIDVGQADCILVQLGSKAMLVDAGNNADAGTIVDYVRAQGVSKLETVVGTHPHEDHIGSLDSVIKSFDIGQVVMPKVTTTTKTYEDVLQAIKDKNLTITAPTPGANLNLGAATCTILAPNGSKYDDLNDWSVVLKLTYGNTSFLLMGDAGHASENEILAKGFDVSADVLKVGHHGSSTATSSLFLNKVSPQYAVIQVGQGNDYGHPSADPMNLLKEKNIPIYRTDECGTVVATSDGKTISWSVQAGSYKSGGTVSGSSGTSPSAPSAPVVVAPPAPSGSNDATVYVTKSGDKYHVDGCRYLKSSKIAIKLLEAKAKGYTPCSVCKPPQ